MRRLLKYITACMLSLSFFAASVLPASAWPVDPDWEDATGTGYARAVSDRYMDFLDGLYGVESAPVWLREFEYYGSSEDDRLRRRMAG